MFDFLQFARDYSIPVFGEGREQGHHVRPGWVGLTCPLCCGDHLAFSLENGYFYCWRCTRVRDAEVVMSLARCSLGEALDVLRKYGGAVRAREPVQPKRRRGLVRPPAGLGALGRPHERYLEGRGFRDVQGLAETWELQGTGAASGVWSWRVVGPVRDGDGRVVAWIGRSIGDARPKYRITDSQKCGADPRTFLYGAHLATGDAVVVVEGPADAWRIGPGAVATLGITWHREQANQIRGWKRRYIMFDPEPEAQKRAMRMAKFLASYPGETEVVGGMGSDPGAMSEKQVDEVRVLL